MTATLKSGSIHIANDVLADLAGYSALESYGVVGMASPTLRDGLVQLLPKQKLRKGVKITSVSTTPAPEKGGSTSSAGTDTTLGAATDSKPARPAVEVDLYVVIEYGTQLAEVSRNLADRVRYTLVSMTEVEVARVDVHVLEVKVRPASALSSAAAASPVGEAL
jgi:uncharacterized alkaline shock family protein YloU